MKIFLCLDFILVVCRRLQQEKTIYTEDCCRLNRYKVYTPNRILSVVAASATCTDDGGNDDVVTARDDSDDCCS